MFGGISMHALMGLPLVLTKPVSKSVILVLLLFPVLEEPHPGHDKDLGSSLSVPVINNLSGIVYVSNFRMLKYIFGQESSSLQFSP
jgi:hypothetical protein